MKRLFTAISLTIFLINITACAAPKAMIIAKIVDAETNHPIEGADVSLGFVYTVAKAHGWGARGVSNTKKGKSDKNGVFSGSGETRQDTMVTAKKRGYYESWESTLNFVTLNKILNRWEPWPCELTVKLRPIKDPVPMYVNSVRMPIPEKNKPCGFDLEVGDWVAPHGKGKINDFILKMKEGEEGGKVKLDTFDFSFSNKLDGIQEFKGLKENQSTFGLPYLAPLYEYSKTYQFNREWHKTERYGYQFQGDNMKDKTFLYRIRTKVDSKGQIISANYGILTGVEFGIYKDKYKTFRFIYKLNSDPKSRSLEYNDRNLFKDRDSEGRLK